MDISYIPTEYALKKQYYGLSSDRGGLREDIICEQPFYYRAFPAQKIDSSFLTLGLGAQRPSLCIGNDFKTKPAPNRNCKEMIYNSIFKRFMNAFLKLTALSSRGKL